MPLATMVYSPESMYFSPDPTQGAVPKMYLDSSGKVRWLAEYTGTTNTTDGELALVIPPNYFSSPVIRLKWRCMAAAPTGQVSWNIRTASIADSEAFSSVSPQSTNLVYTFAADGSDGNGKILETSGTLSTFSLATEEIFWIQIQRFAGSDSNNDPVQLLECAFEYQADVTFQRGYLWLPANAMATPVVSGAVLTRRTSAGRFSYTLDFPGRQTSYAYGSFFTPTNFFGNLQARVYLLSAATNTSSSGLYSLDAGTTGLGGSLDPALASGPSFSMSGKSGDSSQRLTMSGWLSVPGSPVAESYVTTRLARLGASAGDTNPNTQGLLGIMYSYAIQAGSPSVVHLVSNNAAESPSGGITVQKTDGANGSRYVCRFPAGSIGRGDFDFMVPANYGWGGQFRWYWSTSSATGNVRWRLLANSTANGSSSQGALTAYTTQTKNSPGANVISFCEDAAMTNIFSPGHQCNVSLQRLGNEDTASGPVDLHELLFEYRAI